MEKDFFDLYANQSNMAIEAGHNSIADWNIVIYDKKGTALKDAKIAVHAQDCDRAKAFAEAYLKLCEYLCETRGGY